MGLLLFGHLALHRAVALHPHGQAGAALAVVLAPLMASAAIWIWQLVDFIRRSDKPDNDDNGGGGGGGGGEPHPRAPQPDFEPDWWPEFEREFGGYVRSREPQTVRQTAQAV